MVLIIRLNRIAACLALVLLLQPVCAAEAADTPSVRASCALVMAEDGQRLYEKDADRRVLIASTTKLMTALVCLEHTAPEQLVTIKPSHCAVEGSSMYLRAGERYTVRELLTGLLLASGNDAALALAETAGGSERGFVRLMNQKAQALGLENTHFQNPHGLDAEQHYSTAADLARLMFACMENETFRQLNALRSTEVKGVQYLNHNRLLSTCPGCDGGKTGYTRAAGRCLVSCCERDGLRLVCVTLSDPDDWHDHKSLYDWTYARFRLLDLSELCRYELPVIAGSRSVVCAAPEKTARLILPREETVTLSAELPRFVFAPVKGGETAGSVSVIVREKRIAEFPLLFTASAAAAYPVAGQLPSEEMRLCVRESKSL